MRQRKSVSAGLGVGGKVKDVKSARAADLVVPENVIQPPRHEVQASVSVFIGSARRRIPVVIPASAYPAHADRLRGPRRQVPGLGQVDIAKLAVGCGPGVTVEARAIANG